MRIKVHWILDGIAEIETDDQESAESWVHEKLTELLEKNPEFKGQLGAKAIQGKAYLPGSAE